MTYGELKAKIDAKAGDGLTDATVIRELRFRMHSAADCVEVGYDAEHDKVNVIQKN